MVSAIKANILEVGIRNWFERQGDTQKVVTTPAALWPSQAPKGDVLRDQPSSDKNIIQPDDKGNTLYQSALSANESSDAQYFAAVEAGDMRTAFFILVLPRCYPKEKRVTEIVCNPLFLLVGR